MAAGPYIARRTPHPGQIWHGAHRDKSPLLAVNGVGVAWVSQCIRHKQRKGKERNAQRENTVCVPAPLSGLYIPYLTVQYIRYVKLRTVTEL